MQAEQPVNMVDHAFCDAHEQDLSDRQKESDHHSGAGALLIDIQAAAAAGGLFIRRIRAKKQLPSAVMLSQMPVV